MRWLPAMLLIAGCAAAPWSGPDDPEMLLLAADPSAAGVTLWARVPGDGPVRFELAGDGTPRSASVTPSPGGDGTVSQAFSDLAPETGYRYRVVQGERATAGVFRSPPARDVRAAVRFLWGGDVAGQDACRDSVQGMPAFTRMAELEAHFLVGLGDMIYADDPCTATGRYGNRQLVDLPAPGETRESIQAKWRYVREDPSVRRLLAGLGYYAVWDDHEVVNDFDAVTAGALLGPARAAFDDYNPVRRAGDADYRAVRWGRHLELFILDTRSRRDPNAMSDHPGKTLLGPAQRAWLTAAVGASDATWKVVVSSVPIAIPTGWPPEGPRDGWASGAGETGYESELLAILRAWASGGVRNLVFLTTDVHHATGFRYQPFPAYPDFEFHEFVTGPINAGIFPGTALDPTFNPYRLFYHAPASADAVRDWSEALGWFNFGLTEIDPNGRFALRVISAHGETVARQVLVPRR